MRRLKDMQGNARHDISDITTARIVFLSNVFMIVKLSLIFYLNHLLSNTGLYVDFCDKSRQLFLSKIYFCYALVKLSYCDNNCERSCMRACVVCLEIFGEVYVNIGKHEQNK